ncbi:MAG: hypothetical protein IT384_30010 [Deltaproteobacteria bacterium]|nr:hypothetical protein [Deltaproteobacteria bacterium]
MGSALLALALVLAGATPPTAAPSWTKDELKRILSRVEVAGRAPTPEGKDAELAQTIGGAYRLAATAGESVDSFSRRVLKSREPGHPAVLPDQWLLALARRFYDDVAGRADTLARFEVDRKDRLYLEQKGREARAASDQIAGLLKTKLEGGGFIAPLPTAPGEPPGKVGVQALVRDGRVTLKDLDRATFVGDRPPPDIERTPTGAIREFVAAQKQFNLEAQTLGMVNRDLKKGSGQLRAFIPGAAPAIYLNELVRAAKEASMHTLYLMVNDPQDGKQRELRFALAPAKNPRPRGKKAAPEAVKVRCRDEEPMQACVDRAREVAQGAPMIMLVD